MSVDDRQQIQVLHVDDEPELADLTKTFLERSDDRFAVETATGADEGLQRIDTDPPDCVVSDYNMPGMDGLELLQTVREEYPDLPFVLFTGKGSEAVASDAISAGVTDYLQKGSGSEQYELLANRIQNAVSARRSAVAAEQQRHQYEQILKTVPGCVVQLDAGGQFVFANERAEEVLGLESNEATDRTYNDPRWDIRDEAGDPVPDEELPFSQIRETGRPVNDERLDIRWPDGTRKLLSVNGAPVFDEDGAFEGAVFSLADLTDQRERRREVRRLRESIDNANVPITLADPSQEGNPLVYVNDAFEEMTGYSSEEALGRNCRFLQGEGTDPEKTATLREAIDNEEAVSVEFRNYRKDGTEFWNRLTVTPVYDDDDKLVRYLGTQEDITGRKEREQELQTERRSIEQALDTMDDLFYVLDADGSFRRWNDQVPQTTGYSDPELADMGVVELFPADDRETIADAVRMAVSGETVTVEADLLTAGGERLPYEFTGTRLTDADGNTTGLVGIGRDLTERQQRERRFQALVENSSDVISIVDADGVFQYQSPSIERILGYEPGETIGDTAWEYVHPDDRADVIEAFERGVADPDVDPAVEYRARHADGSWRWLEANGNNQLDNPAVEGYIINSREITDRKANERELERTRELLFDMERLADIGAWEYDPDTDETAHTAGELRIYGLAPETDLQLDEAFDFYHPEDTPRLRERFRECIQTGEPYEMDVRVTRVDGEQRWVTVQGKQTQQQDTAVVRGYVQDITAKKERSITLEQVETLFENAQDMLFIIEHSDDEFVVKRVNGAFESATGLSNEELRGKTPQELFGEARGREIEDRYRQCIEAGDSISYEETLVEEQVPNRNSPTNDGLVYWKTHITPVEIDGDVDWIVGSTRDINDQKRREQRLKRRNERLDEFTSIISHDLRNPLRVAEGKLELARDDCDSEHLADAADAVDRCQVLVADMLTLAREGEQVGEMDSIALANVAEQSWQTVATGAAELSVETTQQIRAHSSRLRHLFENLYANAVEHGGEDIAVHVGDIDEGFYVADTGPGIPESEREDVFDAGYSTAEQGTGFGLRIAEQVVDAHGWDITVVEAEQGGARFEITGVSRTS